MSGSLGRRIVAGFVLAWLAAPAVARADPGPHAGDEIVLRVGDVRTLTLPDGDPVRVRVLPGRDTSVTLLARSGHADPRLSALGPDGAILSEDDNGLAGWNSRLVIEEADAAGVVCEVALGAYEQGSVQLELRAGSLPPPVGGALLEETARFNDLVGEAALARGDAATARVSFFNAGQAWFNARSYAPARASLQRALPEGGEADPSLDDGSVLTCAGLVFLGAAEAQLGSLDAARGRLEAGLTRARDLGHQPLQMLALNTLAEVAHQSADAARARELYAAAISLAERMGDETNRLVLEGALAANLADAGEHDRARPMLVAVAARLAELGQPDNEAIARLNLADLLRQRGEFQAALTELDRAEGIATAREVRARLLGARGVIALETGHLVEAGTALATTCLLARELGDPMLEITALHALANSETALGRHASARHYLDEARALADTIDSPVLRAHVMVSMANATWAADGAGDRLEADLAAAWTSVDPATMPRDATRLAATSASAAYEAGELSAALAFAEAQERHAVTAEDEIARAVALGNQAHIRLALGEVGPARELADRAVRLAREGGAWGYSVAMLTIRAEIALAGGELDRAEEDLADIEHWIDGPSVRTLPSEVASQLRAFVTYARASQLSQDLAAARHAAATTPEALTAAVAAGFRDAGRWKGRGLLEGIAEHRSGGRTPELVALRNESIRLSSDREAVATRLARAVRADRVDDADAARLQLSALTRELDDVHDEIARAEPRQAGLDRPGSLPATTVADTLPPDTLLIEYTEGLERLYGYVVQGHGIRFHDLGPLDDLDVSGFLDGMTSRARLAGVDEIARRGRALHARLLEPLLVGASERDEGRPALVIVPSPALAALPFEALVVDHDPRPMSFAQVTFVLDEREVGYSPSTPLLGLLAEVGPRADPGRLLLLADPVYAGESPSQGLLRSPTPTLLPRLPATRDEALAIARLTDDVPHEAAGAEQRDLRWVGTDVDLRTGSEASLEALRDDPARYAIVHVAAHGISGTDTRGTGLALSASGDDGGHVSLHDIMELDLDADLAVLSACETARGSVRRGEGVQSLARAFMYAGARRVVASLWRVPDRSTAALMTRFYTGHLHEGQAPSTALRLARLALRRGELATDAAGSSERGESLGPRRSPSTSEVVPVGHPYTWAPFIHCGLPR